MRKEKSYTRFHAKRISCLRDSWDAFHVVLHLPKPDPLWTQTVNRLLFNQLLLAAIQRDTKPKDNPPVSSSPCQLGADEENVIRYMAGFVPFKLLELYKTKNTEEAAEIVDCLSEIAQPGAGDDFHSYMQEWAKAISRGAIFEVSDAAFVFFRSLDILLRGVLPQHLLSQTTTRDDVAEAVVNDEDLLFKWDRLTGQLSHETSELLLKDITDMWLTIREHAFAK